MKSDTYYLYNTLGQALQEEFEIVDYYFGKYKVLVTPTIIYLFTDLKSEPFDHLDITPGANVDMVEENGKILIYVEDELLKTVE
jgi:hypothetical protein